MMAILEATTKKSSTKVISKRALQKNPSIRAFQKKYVLFLSTCKKFRHTEFAVQFSIMGLALKKGSTKVISKRALQKNPSTRALQKMYDYLSHSP